MRCDAEPGHPRYAGPAQIVKAPPRHSRELIQPALCSTELLEALWFRAERRHMAPAIRPTGCLRTSIFTTRRNKYGSGASRLFAGLCPPGRFCSCQRSAERMRCAARKPRITTPGREKLQQGAEQQG